MTELARSIVRNATGLGLFALVTAGVIAMTHAVTAERIADNRQANEYRVLKQVVPDALHDNDLLDASVLLPAAPELGHSVPFTAWRAMRRGQVSAVILPVTAPDGYSGAIDLLVGIDSYGRLSGVRVVQHRETPGLGDRIEVRKSDWITRFTGLSLDDPPPSQWAVKKDGGRFDAFTGATVTPRAVVGVVRRSLEYFADNRQRLLNASEDDPQ
ncbi:electron transport complex subunit RsxG [Halomonas shantousis]